MAKQKITLKQRKFVLEYLKTGNATNAAIRAGYSRKTARSIGQENLTKPDIQAAIAKVNKIIDDKAICDIKERKTILSAIARGKHSDYLESGADGAWYSLGKDSPNPEAVESWRTTTTEAGEVVTQVSLRDPVRAIAELNKMEGVYAPEKFEGDIRHSMIMKEPDPPPKRRNRTLELKG